MKIAVVTTAFPKLSESFIVGQITGAVDLGHEVDIFAFYSAREEKVHSDVTKYNLLKKVTYFDIPEARIKRILKALKIIFRFFLFHPKEIIKCFNFKKYGSKYKALNNLFKLAPFLRKRYDVVHCHFGPNGLESLFLKEILGVKLVTTFHGYDVTTYVKMKGEQIYRCLFEEGDIFTYNSEATKNRLLQLNCVPRSMVKLPMGIDLHKFVFAERKTALKDDINIISVGRLVEMKGTEYGIRAVAEVVKKFPSIKYSIIGDGLLKDKLQHLIRRLKCERNINLLGWASNDEIYQLYKDSHIFLHPCVTSSCGNMEGQGVVLLEAQACGLPIVATRYSAFPESIVDGKSGFLVPEKDIDAIAEKIIYLIENPQVWPEMGRVGRKFVEEKFDIQKLNNRLVEIYKHGIGA